jgi:hypothetical protein
MTSYGKNPQTSLLRLALFVALASFLQAPLAAQTSAKVSHSAEPDFEGVWSNQTITPLERPPELAGKAFFTKAEAEAYEKQVANENNKDRRDGSAEADVVRAYNEAWWDRGTKVVSTLRTSLIVEPEDGRIPPLTPQARAAAEARAAILQRPPRGPEDRGVQERCIVGANVGPPSLPTAYNNNLQIFQCPGYVAIFNEMVHDFRVIPTDGSPHLPSRFRFWLGDPKGHWEGKTLVVDTTNFNGQVRFRGSDENLRVIERFTRVKPDEILYQFRIEDPTAFEVLGRAKFPCTPHRGPSMNTPVMKGTMAWLVNCPARAPMKSGLLKRPERRANSSRPVLRIYGFVQVLRR